MSKTLIYAAVTTLAGIGIPIMASLNATLGTRLQSPALAAAILFAVGFSISVGVLLISSPPILPTPLPPIRYFLGGLFVAFYVLSITAIAPKFGVGNAVFFVLLGQIVSATIIDHFGLFGAVKVTVSNVKLMGGVLMAVGVFMARKGV
jgi:transporter family-2 protein